MDKIKLLEPLGSGGNSRVFLGKEISTGRKVTVRVEIYGKQVNMKIQMLVKRVLKP